MPTPQNPLVAPRLTSTERDALAAQNGLIVYNTTTGRLEQYDGSSWSAATGPPVTIATASGALSGHRAVVLNSDGTASYADNQTAAHVDQALGVTQGAASGGAPVVIQLSGIMDEPSWSWTPTSAVYLGAGGTLTHTVPVSPALFCRRLGVAVSATRILLRPYPSIALA